MKAKLVLKKKDSNLLEIREMNMKDMDLEEGVKDSKALVKSVELEGIELMSARNLLGRTREVTSCLMSPNHWSERR